MPLISVVICTYNRSGLLLEALHSVARSAVADPGGIEVLVVDNNSSDGTRQVVTDLMNGYPFRLRYVFEPEQGLSHARNRGIQAAGGKYLVFMDDDEKIDAGYLERLPQTFQETGAACVGGAILPLKGENLPRWLVPLSRIHGQLSLGETMRVLLPEDRMLWGGNMAFKRDDLLETGPFDVRLGRKGSERLAGEEHDMQRRFHAAGKKIVYDPRLIQHHYHLTPQLRRKRYWRKHYFFYGRTAYLMSAEEWVSARRFLRVPLAFWRSLVFDDIRRFVGGVLNPDAGKRFQLELLVWRRLGMMYEAGRQ
ncbi:MAG TPA: glycosyltransferase family 2 protein [Gammaproteobacteria bacterium]|nr:glycosyltransferase family 2 protein [Gammaproteobacteria bacterium]